MPEKSFKNQVSVSGHGNAKIVFPLDQASQLKKKKGKEREREGEQVSHLVMQSTNGAGAAMAAPGHPQTSAVLSNSATQSAANPQIITSLQTQCWDLQRKKLGEF